MTFLPGWRINRRNPFRIRLLALLFILALLAAAGCSDPAPPKGGAGDQPAADPKADPELRGVIVAMGDSLTEGPGVDENQAWPALLEKQLQADGYHYKVVNAGGAGETSSGALSRLDWVISASGPDLVILETGANDGLRGLDLELLRKNLDQILFRLNQEKIQVVLAGMQMVKNLGRDYTQNFARIYPEAANRHQAILIPFLLEKVGGEPRFNQADGIHPNAAGHARVAKTVYPYVVQAIEALQKAKNP